MIEVIGVIDGNGPILDDGVYLMFFLNVSQEGHIQGSGVLTIKVEGMQPSDYLASFLGERSYITGIQRVTKPKV